MESFRSVRVAEDPNRYGKPGGYMSLASYLPWGVLDIFDVFRGITQEKEHIDQDSHPLLDEILSLIQQIETKHESEHLIDKGLLEDVFLRLKAIEAEREPIKIFYPQIYARRATASYDQQRREEEERIGKAQAEASHKAVGLRDEAIKLLEIVNAKVQPGIGPADQTVMTHLKKFAALCDQAAEEQKGLVAKVVSTITKKVMATVDEMRATYLGKKKKRSVETAAQGHPLVELLAVLSDTTFSSEIDRQAKIKDALPRLEQYHESFKGVQRFIEERMGPPHKNLKRLRKVLHQFLMLRFIPKMNPQEYIDKAYYQVYTIACRLIPEPLPLHTPERIELDWVIRSLRDPDELTVHAITLVQADLAHEDSLMALYQAALGAGLSSNLRPPPLSASDADKLAWAKNRLGNRAVQEACQNEADEAKKTKHQRFGRHTDAITASSQIDGKIEWAKCRLKSVWGFQFARVDPDIIDPDLKEAIFLARRLEEQIEGRQKRLQEILGTADKLGTQPPKIEDSEKWVENLDLTPYQADRDFVRMVKRFRGEIKTSDEINDDLLDFYKQADRAGLAEYPLPQTEIGYKIQWAKKVIDGEIPCEERRLVQLAGEIREDLHDQFTAMLIYVHGNLRRDETLPKSIEQIHVDLLEFYALAKRIGQEIELLDETDEQINWVYRAIDRSLDWKNVELNQFAARIKKDLNNSFIKKYIDHDGNLTCDPSIPKIEWAQAQLKGCFRALFQPENREAQKGAELVWMATAHYQQLQELDHIRVQVSQNREVESIGEILQNLNLVIKALEMQPTLLGTEHAQALTKVVVESTLDWIRVAHEFCRQEQQNAIKQGEIDEAFEPIYRYIRAGDHLEAFKTLKALLEKSPLATRMLLERTSRTELEDLGHAFNLFLEQSPPKKPSLIHQDVLRALGKEVNASLEKADLVSGVEIQRKKMVSNVLVLAGFRLLDAIFKGPRQREIGLRQTYVKYREVIDTIRGDAGDYDSSRVRGAITGLVQGSGFNPDDEPINGLIVGMEQSIDGLKARYGDQLQSDQGQNALLVRTIENTLSILITLNQKDHELQCYVARAFIPILLWVVELFVEPFSHTLIQRFTEDVILESDGQLRDLHLKPLEGVNEGLATYNGKVQVWPEMAQRNHKEDPRVPSFYREVRGASHSKDLEVMLEAPHTYPQGLTPSQIDQRGLYMCVDEYLHVAHLCQNVDGLFADIKKTLFAKSYDNPILNAVAFGIKGLLSLLPYTYAWGYFMVLRISEIMINFSLQQLAKLLIWQLQAGTEISERTLKAMVNSSSYTTGLDKIFLEKLKDLEKDLEREVKLAKSDQKGAASVNHEPIRALLSHIRKTIETVKCDTPDDVRNHASSRTGLESLEVFVTDQAKLVVVPMIIKTIESFLNQESMLLALYRGLELVNKGVREEAEPLDALQMAELKREKKKGPQEQVTPDEIRDKVDKIHHGLKREMAAVLKRILETTANPMIDRAIDQFAKQPGQVVSETISWLEKALYNEGFNGSDTTENILVLLQRDLAKFDEEDVNINRLLNGMYENYSHFIKIFREHEKDLDKHQSYNGILLVKNVFIPIAKPLDELTMALAEVMKNPGSPGQIAQLQLKLEAMKRAVGDNRPHLNQVKESEASSHAERHSGILGQTLGSTEKLLALFKERIKPPVHEGLGEAVTLLAEHLTMIPKKPVLVRHLVRSAIVPYIKA